MGTRCGNPLEKSCTLRGLHFRSGKFRLPTLYLLLRVLSGNLIKLPFHQPRPGSTEQVKRLRSRSTFAFAQIPGRWPDLYSPPSRSRSLSDTTLQRQWKKRWVGSWCNHPTKDGREANVATTASRDIRKLLFMLRYGIPLSKVG